MREDSFHSADYKTLEEIIEEFLSAPLPKPPAEDELADEPVEAQAEGTTEAPELPPEPIKLTAACFGVAGPVIDNRCRTTNLPWFIDGATLAERFAISQVRLLNDLEATAHGLLLLNPDEIVVLNAGAPPKKKQALALIAAGIASQFVGVLAACVIGVLSAIPLFFFVAFSPLFFLSGLVEVFKSNFWTFSYREFRPRRRLCYPCGSFSVVNSPHQEGLVVR